MAERAEITLTPIKFWSEATVELTEFPTFETAEGNRQIIYPQVFTIIAMVVRESRTQKRKIYSNSSI